MSIISVMPTIKNVKSIKTATRSYGSPAPFLSTSEPPNIIPNPPRPNMVIAVKRAVIAAVGCFDSVRSLRSAPQRLQKLNPVVKGVPQFEQYMVSSFRDCDRLLSSRKTDSTSNRFQLSIERDSKPTEKCCSQSYKEPDYRAKKLNCLQMLVRH